MTRQRQSPFEGVPFPGKPQVRCTQKTEAGAFLAPPGLRVQRAPRRFLRRCDSSELSLFFAANALGEDSVC